MHENFSRPHVLFDNYIFFCTASASSFDSLQCLLPDGTSCPKSLCQNNTIDYIWNTPPLNSQLGYTKWNFSSVVGNWGNCNAGYMLLQQPIIAQGCTNQSKPCGQYTGSIETPCTMTSLTVMITQDLDGTIIQCQNINSTISGTTNSRSILGASSIVISGECIY